MRYCRVSFAGRRLMPPSCVGRALHASDADDSRYKYRRCIFRFLYGHGEYYFTKEAPSHTALPWAHDSIMTDYDVSEWLAILLRPRTIRAMPLIRLEAVKLCLLEDDIFHQWLAAWCRSTPGCTQANPRYFDVRMHWREWYIISPFNRLWQPRYDATYAAAMIESRCSANFNAEAHSAILS